MGRKKDKNFVWQFSIDDYIKIVEIAMEAGVKPGESMEEYFIQYAIDNNLKPIGTTNKDMDMFAGDLREDGKKVLDLRNKKKKEDEDNER